MQPYFSTRGRRLGGVGLLLLLSAGLIGLSYYLYAHSSQRTRGAFVQQAYVWQHAWPDALLESIGRNQAGFSNLLVLAADVQFTDGLPRVSRVDIDFRLLRSKIQTVGIVIHLGKFDGNFADERVTAPLIQLAKSLVVDAAAEAFEVREIQLDFDCDPSRLMQYASWISAIRAAISPVHVTFTALPKWLDHEGFDTLAKGSDGFVLQIYSLTQPARLADAVSMVDPAAALLHTELAAKVGVPFRIALPTHGWILAFDSAGKFIASSTEDPSPRWPADARLRTVRADPRVLARIVRNIEADRPLLLYGILWTRFPAPGDHRNWKMRTLKAVMQGQEPLPDLQVAVTRPETRVSEIWLINVGDADAAIPGNIVATWSSAALVAADAMVGFERVSSLDATVAFRPQSQIHTLAPGEKRLVGWIRLDTEAEVRAVLGK